jgi:tripartite-type tricarboxylate transporter receptor subunit TctC
MQLSSSSLLGLVLTAALSATAAQAQTYPNKPIRLIVPLVAGSAADGTARIVMPAVSKRLGQPIVIENEGGAGAIPGTTRASKAAPDGYTLLQCNPSSAVVNELIYKSLPYDPVNDFIPVANTSAQALIMAVPATSPIKSVKEFVDAWKAGKAERYASLGPGTSAHLAAERLKVLVGKDLKHIPFPPGPQAPLALGRGELDMMFYGLASFQPGLQSGTVRLIGIAMPQRSALTPDLPTMREQGYDVVIQAWYGVCAPKGTPKDIVDKLASAINETVNDPEIIKQLNAAGTDAAPTKSAADFADFIAKERETYTDIVAKAGIPKT